MMINLSKACKDAVQEGIAEQVAENVFVLTGEIDASKLYKLQKEYLEEFDKLHDIRLRTRHEKQSEDIAILESCNEED